MNPEVTLLHVRGEAIGYARYGSYLHDELTRAGVDVYDRIEAPSAPNYNEYLIEQDDGTVIGADGTEPRRHKQTNVVCWVSVPTHARGWWRGQVPVISTMWEANVLPESFRENIHAFDTVIVPSDQNVELFSRYHPNVRKVPLGIDPERWHYVERKAPTTAFNFLIGGSGKRKGTDLAVKAFRKLWGTEGSWGDGPEPRLILKSPKPEDHYGRGLTRVGGRISAAEEVALYASAHVYLQPSRGEGFGLQPLQAIAQGLPTILTDAHGHRDFAHLGMGLSWEWRKADYFIYGDAGDWWEPSFDELCDHMRWCYENYDAACDKAKVSAEIAATSWTWQRTAAAFIDAIGPDRLCEPYTGDGEWVAPEAKLFHVRVNRGWQAEIADGIYQFTPGVDYWERADIKRVLFEAGLLDPVCLNMVSDQGDTFELGLTEAQVAQLGGYRAAHAYCEQCGQRLGSSPTRADEIFAELEARAAR